MLCCLPESLEELASIKTKEELIGDIITLLQSPINRVISALENASEGKAEDEKIYSAQAAPAPAAESASEETAAPETPAAE